MSSRLLLIDLVPNSSSAYREGGNRLLSSLLGADCRVLPNGTDVAAALALHADDLRRRGCRPYIVPFGGSNWLGSLGYVACGLEIADQCPKAAAVYVACGSGGTQAGLLAGLSGTQPMIPVVGINVLDESASARTRIETILEDIGRHAALDVSAVKAAICLDDTYRGDGYGIPTAAGLDAIVTVARASGIVLDPVYTGKAMSALLHDIEHGRYPAGSDVVFVNTGGFPGVFAYVDSIKAYAVEKDSGAAQWPAGTMLRSLPVLSDQASVATGIVANLSSEKSS